MMNRDHCALCGQPRRATQPQQKSFGYNDLITIKDHRELMPGRAEESPSMMVGMALYVSIRRNGGESEDCHLCEDCIRIGLQRIKTIVESALNRP